MLKVQYGPPASPRRCGRSSGTCTNSRTSTTRWRCSDFATEVDGKLVEGIDKLTFDERGSIAGLKVMLTSSAVQIVGARMAKKSPRVGLGLPQRLILPARLVSGRFCGHEPHLLADRDRDIGEHAVCSRANTRLDGVVRVALVKSISSSLGRRRPQPDAYGTAPAPRPGFVLLRHHGHVAEHRERRRQSNDPAKRAARVAVSMDDLDVGPGVSASASAVAASPRLDGDRLRHLAVRPLGGRSRSGPASTRSPNSIPIASCDGHLGLCGAPPTRGSGAARRELRSCPAHTQAAFASSRADWCDRCRRSDRATPKPQPAIRVGTFPMARGAAPSGTATSAV